MGMSFSKGGDTEVMVEMNTTPLIDVMLVLLVMLIITIPIQLHAVNLNLPIGNPPPPQLKPEVVQIDVDEHSQIYWQGVPATLDEVHAKFALAAQQAVQPEVHLRPNKRAKYLLVAGLLADSQRLGLTKIGIIGSEQFVH